MRVAERFLLSIWGCQCFHVQYLIHNINLLFPQVSETRRPWWRWRRSLTRPLPRRWASGDWREREIGSLGRRSRSIWTPGSGALGRQIGDKRRPVWGLFQESWAPWSFVDYDQYLILLLKNQSMSHFTGRRLFIIFKPLLFIVQFFGWTLVAFIYAWVSFISIFQAAKFEYSQLW